jgi:hypothetical protein
LEIKVTSYATLKHKGRCISLKILKEGQIRAGLYELAGLIDIPIEDLKAEFQDTIENVSGKDSTIFLGDDKETNCQIQTMVLEKLYKVYKKPLQFRKFLNKETTEEAKEAETVEEAE